MAVCVTVYHCKCIDTWLVQDSDLCPLCKKSVIDDDDTADQQAGTAAVSGSVSQSAAAAASNISSVQDDDEQAEDAPLLHGFRRQRPRRYGSGSRGTSISLCLTIIIIIIIILVIKKYIIIKFLLCLASIFMPRGFVLLGQSPIISYICSYLVCY